MIKSLQKKVLILVIVCITLCLAPTNNVYAKVVTDEEVQFLKERNEAYRAQLESDYSFEDGQPALYFGLVDINGDGIEELTANTNDLSEYKYPGNVLTYSNGKIYWMSDLWTKGGIYYCPSTKNFMVCGSIDLENMKMSAWGVDINIFCGTINTNCYGGFECLYSAFYDNENKLGFWHDEKITQEEISQQNIPENEIGYYYDEQGNIIGYYRIVKDSKEEVMKKIDRLMPTKILVESPYKNTPENRDKYLPIDEATIRAMLEAKYGVDNKGDDFTNNKPDSNQQIQNQPTKNEDNQPTADDITNSEDVGNIVDKIVSKNDATIYIDGINATVTYGANLDSKVIENYEQLTNLDSIIKTQISNWENHIYYELNLLDNNQVPIEQLDGIVTVHVTVPFTINAENQIKVFRIEDKVLIECVSKVIGNEVSFETNHFSTYAIVEVSEQASEIVEGTEVTENDILTESPSGKEPESTFPWGVVIIVILLILATGAIGGKVLYDKYVVRKDNE